MAARGQSLDITSLMNQRAMSVQRFALFSGIPLTESIWISRVKKPGESRCG